MVEERAEVSELLSAEVGTKLCVVDGVEDSVSELLAVELGRVAMPCAEDVVEGEVTVLALELELCVVDEVNRTVEISLQLSVELGRVAMLDAEDVPEELREVAIPWAEEVVEAEISVLLSAELGVNPCVVDEAEDWVEVSLQLSVELWGVAVLNELREVATPWPVDVVDGRLKMYGPQEVVEVAMPGVEDALDGTEEV